MGRTHVHCSTGLPANTGGSSSSSAAVVSGMRADAELLVYIDVRRSLDDGALTWWLSDNGVVLTEGRPADGLVPAKYFKEVVGRRVDVGTLWRDGEKLADLPPGTKGRLPPGKQAAARGGRRRGNRGRGTHTSAAAGPSGRPEEMVAAARACIVRTSMHAMDGSSPTTEYKRVHYLPTYLGYLPK